MYRYKKKIVDLELFKGDDNSHLTKFNLPQKVYFCKKCNSSNQRPTTRAEHLIKEDNTKATRFFNGICEACVINEDKETIDWDKREYEFKKLLDKYRSRNGSYDVVVPGSGGKDSFVVAHKLKHKYKMNPITITFSPFIYTPHGRRNFDNWINAGFENFLHTPDQTIYSLLSRIALENLYHPWHPWILGQKNSPPKFAAQKNIPLVIYGDSPSEYGSSKEEFKTDYLIDWHTIDSFENCFISGESLETLYSYGLKKYQLEPFIPMLKSEFMQKKIRCLAYSYFHKWHPQENYYYSVKHSNFQPAESRTTGTYSKYASIDDKLDHLYFYTYFIKYGIGRATSDASQEIRNKDRDLEEGKLLIKRFDGEFFSEYSDEIFDYLSITNKKYSQEVVNLFEEPILTKKTFDHLTNFFRSPHLWKLNENKDFELRYK